MHSKICVQCGKNFQSKRSDAKTCSPECRLKMYDDKHKLQSHLSHLRFKAKDELKGINPSLVAKIPAPESMKEIYPDWE